MSTWPPAYSVRASRRAKRLILQISPRSGLEIIIPHTLKQRSLNPQSDIHALLNEKRQWVEKNLARYKPPSPLELPNSLSLLSIQKVFQIQYKWQAAKRLKIKCKICGEQRPAFFYSYHACFHDHYVITGPIEDYASVFRSLRSFLKTTAIHFLTAWLQALSLETGLFYSSVAFRRQSTLWGSCTASKKISLNIQLLFLPPHLVRYVLLHELCHTQYLNHSKRYWNLLKTFDSHCLQHRKALASAGQYLPAWLHA